MINIVMCLTLKKKIPPFFQAMNLGHHLIFQNIQIKVNLTAYDHFDQPVINVWLVPHLSACI